MPQALPAGTKHSDWLGADIPWVTVADAVLRLPGESVGADAEVSAALKHGIPVYQSVADIIRVPPVSLPQPAPRDISAVVSGVGPDAPIVKNALGGKQSDSPYRMDLMPARAVLATAAVFGHGAKKYGDNNWHAIDVKDHVNHLLVHAYAYLAGDTSDDHLEHLACRSLMALEIELRCGPVKQEQP